tara:strand:- start:852 stop:1535 length:684 start_codon:yes stop_codon:yes gene_type:complete
VNFHRGFSEDVKIISPDPLVGLVDDFISREECEFIVSEASGLLTRSKMADRKGELFYGKERTSRSALLSDSPYLERETKKIISEKIKRYFSFKVEEFENLQMVHYKNQEKFNCHHDSDPPMKRLCTILIYLNDVHNLQEQGGATIFPPIKTAIAPKKGRAIAWYNYSNDGTYDARVMHIGQAVKNFEKWALNVWIQDDNLKLPTDDFVKSEKEKNRVQSLEGTRVVL